jgi:hypothetical protein
MLRPTRSRWALLALPLLIGAVLLMHGLDAGSTESLTGSTTVREVSHGHTADAPAAHDDSHCSSCHLGHVMAACLAVLATCAALAALRRTGLGGRAGALTAIALVGGRGWVQPPRSRPPTWLVLAVMQR